MVSQSNASAETSELGGASFLNTATAPICPQLSHIEASSRFVQQLGFQLLVQAENQDVGAAGLLLSLVVTTADGQTIRLVTDGSWRAALSPGANWLHQPPVDTAWSAPRVVGEQGVAPWGLLNTGEPYLPPVPYLRTTFPADRPV